MTPDQIRRSWDDDEAPRSVFPEPLAERLTRENKELRAEVERLRADVKALAEQVADAGRRDRAVRALIDEAELRRPLAHSQDGTPFPALIAATDLRAVLDKHAGEQP